MADGKEEDKAMIKSWEELPEDLLYKIFSWLPAKSILKFKLCSKSIYEFTTKDKDFVWKNTQNLIPQGDSSFFIQGLFKRVAGEMETKLYPIPGQNGNIILKSFVTFLNKRFGQILMSVNGLLLCKIPQKSKGEFIVCNPITQLFSSIVAPPFIGDKNSIKTIRLNFSVDDDDDEYKYELLLIEIYQDQQGSVYRVRRTYKPREAMWKERDKILLEACRNSKELDCYYKEYIYEIRCSRPEPTVIWNKSKLSFMFWVRRDSSWSMYKTLSLEEIGLKGKIPFIRGCLVRNNGHSLIFATKREVYCYDMRGNARLVKVGKHKFATGSLGFVPFYNTLASCGPHARQLALY